MKNLSLALLVTLLAMTTNAQIGIGTTSPNSSLDVRGSLSAKYTAFSANTTAGSSDNLLVFTGTSAATLTLPDATACQGRIYWIKSTSSNASVLTIATTSSQTIDGASSWTLAQTNKAIRVVSSGTAWLVTAESVPGNTGTAWIHGGNSVASQQNFGTTSNYHLPFITNNTERMRLTSTGSLGIGTSTFNATYTERLLVDGGASGNTNYQNVIVGKGNTNSYAQLNIQNNSTGTAASSDVVSTANNGDESSNFVDLGINGGGNTSTGVLGGANTAYLYSTGNDFSIGNGTSLKNLNFFTTTGGTYTERMRINSVGDIGMGNSSPTEKLDITGNLKFSGALMPGGSAGSVGTFLVSTGSGSAPTWFDASGYAWLIDGNSVSSTRDFGTTNNHDLPFITNNSEKMRITTSGNIGVGLTSPNYLLHMHKPSATSNWMQITNSASGTGMYDGFFYGVAATGQPQIWGEGDLAIITGSGTTNNTTMTLAEDGYVAVNTTTFNSSNPEQLLVNASATGNTDFQNVIVGKGNTNSYAQLNIQNMNTSTGASSDVVATSNNGNESVNFIDMGINGGGNTSTGVIGGANTAYLYSTGNNFAIGNGTNSKDIVFFTTASSTFTDRMHITSAGHLIPTTTNAYNLGSSTNRWATIYSQAVLNTSDARLKKNIKDLNYGLSAVMNLRPVRYNWKEGIDKGNRIGFLAQELRTVVPEVVIGDESKENLAVNYIELIPVLVNAIKEQQKQIAELQKKVKILERK